jgi:hypothetical protein
VGTSTTSPRRGRHASSKSGRRLPPGCGHRTPRPATVSANQLLVRTPGSGCPPDGHGGTPDHPVGRTSQFNLTPWLWARTRPACEGPAADTSSVRPCASPADHACSLLILVMTGQEGDAHTRLGQPQPLPAHRDPPVMTRASMLNGGRPEPGPRPMSARFGVRRPDGRHDRTGFRTPGQASGHRMPGRIWADTVTSNRHATAEMEGTRTGDGPSARPHSDILDSHNHEDGRPDAGPPMWGRTCGLATNDPLGDGGTTSATAATAVTRPLLGIAPPSRPRLGALLSCVGLGGYERGAMALRKVRVCLVGLVREGYWGAGMALVVGRCAGREGGVEREMRGAENGSGALGEERDRGA